MPQRRDLTIDEAVRDPMIRLVMKADGVDPRALETMLRSLAGARGAPNCAASPDSVDDDEEGTSHGLSWVASAFGRARAAGEACVSW